MIGIINCPFEKVRLFQSCYTFKYKELINLFSLRDLAKKAKKK